MSNFEEWFEDYEDKFEINAEILCKDAFQAGAKSQQAKIDELQARVDEALKHLDLAYPESWGYCVDQAIDILKGNKDEK